MMLGRLYAFVYVLGWSYSVCGLWNEITELFPGLVPTSVSGWEGVARIAIMFAVFYGVMFTTALPVLKKAIKKGEQLRQHRIL
jgi:hypothetical protein